MSDNYGWEHFDDPLLRTPWCTGSKAIRNKWKGGTKNIGNWQKMWQHSYSINEWFVVVTISAR